MSVILKQIGLIMGVVMAVVLFLGFGALSSLFSTDPEVLRIAKSGTLVRIAELKQLPNELFYLDFLCSTSAI